MTAVLGRYHRQLTQIFFNFNNNNVRRNVFQKKADSLSRDATDFVVPFYFLKTLRNEKSASSSLPSCARNVDGVHQLVLRSYAGPFSRLAICRNLFSVMWHLTMYLSSRRIPGILPQAHATPGVEYWGQGVADHNK